MAGSDDRVFVGYHNRERMGFPLRAGKGPFTMLTNRPVEYLRGHVEWVIEGHGMGRARQYELCHRFTVQKVVQSEDADFRFEYSGDDGDHFKPPIRLTEEPWFRSFFTSVGDFGIGATTIQLRFLEESERLVGEWAEGGRRSRAGSSTQVSR
jgi:hypothetical protein